MEEGGGRREEVSVNCGSKVYAKKPKKNQTNLI